METPDTLVFDVNETLLDLSDLQQTLATALGDNPYAARLWFRTLLHYSLVETLSEHWVPFSGIAAGVLQMIAREEGIHLEEDEARLLLQPLLSAPAHQDVPEALERLQKMGYTLYALTNSDEDTLNRQMENAGLTSFFADTFSVSSVQQYKPALPVYQWACGQIKRPPASCLMVAAHAWDLTGAARAGMQTAFVLRPGQQWYPKAPASDLVCTDLRHLADQLALRRT